MQGVFAMGAVILWRRDPTGSPALFVVLTPIVAAASALTVRLLSSYARGEQAALVRGRTVPTTPPADVEP